MTKDALIEHLAQLYLLTGTRRDLVSVLNAAYTSGQIAGLEEAKASCDAIMIAPLRTPRAT